MWAAGPDDRESDAFWAQARATRMTLHAQHRLSSAAPTGHDDYVTSLALAVHAARSTPHPRGLHHPPRPRPLRRRKALLMRLFDSLQAIWRAPPPHGPSPSIAVIESQNADRACHSLSVSRPLSEDAWRTNPLANRIVELTSDVVRKHAFCVSHANVHEPAGELRPPALPPPARSAPSVPMVSRRRARDRRYRC